MKKKKSSPAWAAMKLSFVVTLLMSVAGILISLTFPPVGLMIRVWIAFSIMFYVAIKAFDSLFE